MLKGFFYTGASAFTASMMSAGACWAQDLPSPAASEDAASAEADRLGEIVVTAQKREQNLQEVPVSIAALTADSLKNRGVSNIEDLGRTVTGMQVTVSSGAVLPFVRGVGNTATTTGNESSVAVYVDGVYYSRLPSGVFQLRNVDRVEVLKGPQGTLFGRNASAGVIHVVTRDPSHTAAVEGSIGYGRFDTVEGSLYATTGLTDTMAMDLAVSGRFQGKGWGKNLVSGQKANYYNDFSVRSKLLFEPSDTTRLTLSGFYAFAESVGQSNAFPGTTRGYLSAPFVQNPSLPFYDQDTDFPNNGTANLWGASLKVEQELSFARLTSITAYIKTVNDYKSDGDQGPRPDFAVYQGGPIEQFTQELQLGSLKGSPLQWTLGAFYYNTKNAYDERTFFFSPSGAVKSFGPNGLNALGRSHPKSYALFGQATYEVLPRLSLTGGLRYTWDRTTADGELRSGRNGPIIADPSASQDSYNKLTFRAAVDYQATDNALVYASFSRGFKSGVYNLLTYNPVPSKPEVLDAYEVGFKTNLLGHRVRLNGAAYYYDLTNPQVSLIQNSAILFSNADSARVKGAELDAEALLVRGLTARLGVSYTDSTYVRYPNAPSGAACNTSLGYPLRGPCPESAFTSVQVSPFGSLSPLRSVDAKGNHLPFSPKWTINAGLDYQLETSAGNWNFTIDGFYNGGYYTEPDNFIHVHSFVIINSQIKFMPSEHFGLRIWSKNLLNEKYVLRASAQSGPPGWPFNPGAPRTYGVAVDFKF